MASNDTPSQLLINHLHLSTSVIASPAAVVAFMHSNNSWNHRSECLLKIFCRDESKRTSGHGRCTRGNKPTGHISHVQVM